MVSRHARHAASLSRRAKALLIALCIAGTGSAAAAAAELASSGATSGPKPAATYAAGYSPRPAASDQNAVPASAAAESATHPVSVSIPAIHVAATLQELNLGPNGALTPPTNFTQAGWYAGSPVPGTPGPSVIAGHVDSASGPAVFSGLKNLKAGDEVSVGLSDGRTVTFKVVTVQSYAKDAFPTAVVYGARPDPELRLITCGGAFTDGHYVDNVVVYATLA